MKKTVFIVGPTASGKTSISIDCATKMNGEIINADSVQIYKEFDIGSAKIKEEEKRNIKHYMIDVCTPSEEYNVQVYSKSARQIIHSLLKKNTVPFIVGGSGLYINSLIYELHFGKTEPNYELRKYYELKAKFEGTESLYQELLKKDSAQAEKIGPNNYPRLVRALEIINMTGEKMSEQREVPKINKEIHPLIIGLYLPRDILIKRIEKRIDTMLDAGLIEEVNHIVDKYGYDIKPLEAIGYKEVVAFLNGLYSYTQMRERLIVNTRQYAKRQMTWFRKIPIIHWFNVEQFSSHEIVDKIIALYKAGDEE